MKYALLIYASSQARDEQVANAWIDYIKELSGSGALLAAEQLTTPDTATSLRLRGGKRLLTDGPFMETKEHLLGFFLIDVPDLDAALEWAARAPNAPYGTVEVRAAESGQWWRALLAS